MAGQRSLPIDRRLIHRWMGVAFFVGILLGSGSTNVSAAPPHTMQREVRIHWTSQHPVRLVGSVQIDTGLISSPQNLSMDPHSTGGLRIQPGKQRLTLAPRGLTEQGGLQFTALGDDSSKLTLQVSLERAANVLGNKVQIHPITLRLSDLDQDRPYTEVAPGIKFRIQRAPGDAIQTDFSRDSMVFWSGEQVPLRIQVSPASIRVGESLTVRLRIRHARGGPIAFEKQWPTTVDSTGRIPVIEAGTVTMPDQEGAFDFEFECYRIGSRRLPLLQPNEISLARRPVQVVVVKRPSALEPTNKKSSSTAAAKGALRLTERFQPFGKTWSIPDLVPSFPNVLPKMPSLLAKDPVPITSGPLEKEQHDQQPVAVLAPGGWYAHPISITDRSRAHLVTVRYPIGNSMRLGVSVVQQDAAGSLRPLGTDSGFATDVPLDNNLSQPWGEHRVVFWPQSNKPYVVLANHDTSEPARFGEIRVEVAPQRLVDTLATSHPPEKNVNAPSHPGRLAALYLDKPLIAECFGDEGYLDPKTGMVLEDWQTFLKAGQHMVDYLQWAGFNGAILSVSSEGGTLYPTKMFTATPRFDTGPLSSSGHDPVRKDVLELLLRLFDSAGLRLVPVIEMATPLPALEALCDQPGKQGLEWTDASGARLPIVYNAQEGIAPYYNPLDDRVQHQLVENISELTKRYGDHPSFDGVGLHTGPQTYTQMQTSQWGRDPKTLSRFALFAPETPTDPQQQKQWIDNQGRNRFLAWRANEMTALYRTLAAATEGHKLILITTDHQDPIDKHPQNGLEWSQLAAIENLVPLRLIKESIFQDAVQQIDNAQANEDTQWDQTLTAFKQAGGLVFRSSTVLRLNEADSHSQKAAKIIRGRWFTHAIPSGARYRRQVTRLFDQFDPQVLAVGGWTPALGQEDQLRDVLKSFVQLPAVPMQTVPATDSTSSSVRVRQLATDQGPVVSVVNLAPWTVKVQVIFEHDITIESQATVTTETTSVATGLSAPATRTWHVTIPPGDLVVARVGPTPNKINRWSAVPAQNQPFVRELSNRMQDLAARVSVLCNPRPYPVLHNGSFEEPVTSSIPGWLHAQYPVNSVQIVDGGADGKKAVRLTNSGTEGAKTWMVSGQIQTPPTGRLAVSLRARVPQDSTAASQSDAQVRIAVEGHSHGRLIRRDVVMTFQPMDSWQEEPFWLEIADLGVQNIEQLRLTVDLLTPGEIWLDDIRLYDFFLTEQERTELRSQIFLAVEHLRKGNLNATSRLFDSHWGRYLMGLRVPTEETDKVPVEPKKEEPMPGVAERLKKWLPSPIF